MLSYQDLINKLLNPHNRLMNDLINELIDARLTVSTSMSPGQVVNVKQSLTTAITLARSSMH